MCLILVAWSGVMAAQHLMAQALCPTKRNSTFNQDTRPELERIRSALRLEPGNWALYMKLAESRGNMAARLRREGNGDRTSQLREQALRAWQQALHRNPLQGWIWYEMGTALTRMPYDNRGYAASLRHADSAVRQAVEMRPVDPELLYSAARYWLWRSSLSGFAVQDPPDYKRLFRQAVELQSNLWPQVARAVWTATTNTETILECLPQEPVWARRINRWVDKQKTVD